MAVDEKKFKLALNGKKIPLLVLDHKWHHIFAAEKKPRDISEYENRLNELLREQSAVKGQIKDYKKLKNDLMQSIVGNMEGAERENSVEEMKLTQDKNMIEELNEKIAAAEDKLLEIPEQMSDINLKLMLSTMAFCYEKLHANAKEAKEIGEWILGVRVELKKKIIRKQFVEVKIKEMFSYMNAVIGPEVLDVFDINYDEGFELKPPEEGVTKKSEGTDKKDKEQNFVAE